jgi:hypothetical protein
LPFQTWYTCFTAILRSWLRSALVRRWGSEPSPVFPFSHLGTPLLLLLHLLLFFLNRYNTSNPKKRQSTSRTQKGLHTAHSLYSHPLSLLLPPSSHTLLFMFTSLKLL